MFGFFNDLHIILEPFYEKLTSVKLNWLRDVFVDPLGFGLDTHSSKCNSTCIGYITQNRDDKNTSNSNNNKFWMHIQKVWSSIQIKWTFFHSLLQIFMPRAKAAPVLENAVVLEKDSKALTTFNVSDPNMTIVFSVQPSTKVSLILMLAQGSPPNDTYSRNTTILNQTGNYHDKQP